MLRTYVNISSSFLYSVSLTCVPKYINIYIYIYAYLRLCIYVCKLFYEIYVYMRSALYADIAATSELTRGSTVSTNRNKLEPEKHSTYGNPRCLQHFKIDYT